MPSPAHGNANMWYTWEQQFPKPASPSAYTLTQTPAITDANIDKTYYTDDKTASGESWHYYKPQVTFELKVA